MYRVTVIDDQEDGYQEYGADFRTRPEAEAWCEGYERRAIQHEPSRTVIFEIEEV